MKCIKYSPFIIGAILFSLIFSYSPASASSNLTITPITWNVIGLDSNNIAVGPNNFPVGARVCNSGAPVTNLVATFYWEDGKDLYTGDTYINLRSGSLSTISLASLGTSECHDFYFEASVTRNSAAYNRTRRYYITVTADGGVSLTTPRPRELFVERLISQNRNATTTVKLDGVSIPAGGSMNLMVGSTYTITLVASTATNGYEQIESFINFPNTIFKINQVSTTYSANGGTDSSAASKLYADGCRWENDPNSPNYRSCLATGKYGGNITIDYNVTIISGAGTSQTLSTLIYDFSGSSYHYNSDFGVGSRIANIVSPGSISIAKRFVPDTITPGGVSTLTLILSNPSTVAVSGINFTDPLPTTPSNVVVAASPSASTTGCGSPTFNPQHGDQSLSFSNGTIAPNSTCIIKVNVTAPTNGTYINTTNHLFINDSIDTGNSASANLTVASAPTCTPGVILARWTVPNTATNPPDTTGGLPTTKASNVSTATASAYIPSKTSIATSLGQNDTYSWYSYGYKNDGQYLDFVIDTRRYSGVSMNFYASKSSSGGDPTTLIVSYNNGSGVTQKATYTLNTTLTQYTIDFTGLTSTNGSTTFRISASGATNDNSGAGLYVDYLSFTGCSSLPPAPTLSKSFSPATIPVNTVSRLTFTISNTQPGNEALTGVQFSDTLPEGLVVASPANASTTCSGSPTWSPTSGSSSLVFGNPVGATLASGASCTAAVDVLATRAGQFDNVSGYISSTQSGENKSSNGYATASLTAIAPPNIAISFLESPIYTGESTSLSFSLSNPNQASSLSGVGFSLTLPSGLSVESLTSSACGGTLTITAPNSIVLSGGSLSANNSCTFNVTVTGNTSGLYTAQTSVVTSTEGGNGNFDSDTLEVREKIKSLNLLKQVGLSASGPWYSFVSLTPPLPKDVYFRFTIENTGDITITNASLTELSYPGLDLSDCTSTLSGGLDLYETLSCVSGAHSVSATNFYTNTAYATGDSVNSDEKSAYFATSELTLDKTSAMSHFAGAGNVLQYTYIITNTGFAPLLGPVTVTDDKASDESCPQLNTQGDLDDWFDPGETLVCTASYTVLSGDVTFGSVTNEAYATVSGVDSNPDTATVTYAPMDFGDLPDTYNNTLWADNGARHTVGSLYLGASVSAKADGSENADAAADGNDDGVLMTGNWSDGSGNLDVTVTGGKGCLMGWLDYRGNSAPPYNPDGDFDDAGEVIINNQALNSGTTSLSFSLPSGAANSATWFARFRLVPDLDNDGDCSDQTPPGYSGEAENGEVEDYRIRFSPTSINLKKISATSIAASPATPLILIFTLVGSFGLLKWGSRKRNR